MLKPSEIVNSIIHVIPSFACNLDCSHCDQKQKLDKYQFNEQKFFEILNQLNPAKNSIALFGGEPLLNKFELFKKIIETGKINTTTTNLLLLTPEKLDLLIKYNVTIGTSWNPDRMTDEQYEIWKQKIKDVNNRGKNVALFITLTENILNSKLYDVLDEMNELKVATVTFSPVVPSTKELIEKFDDFMCELDTHWKWKFRNKLREEYLTFDGKKNCCKNTSFILYPNGDFNKECVHTDYEYYWDGYPECKNCEFKNICRPCPKQPCCHFFKKYWLMLARHTMLNTYSKAKGTDRKLIPTFKERKIEELAKSLVNKYC